ncbi:MAG: NAD(P)/FAD-dependent oxidoreductase [Acidobacteriota bacterium]
MVAATDFDVAVVGAGIAGCTTAALLGRAGFRVLLLDKAAFPRSKVCGEGLMPAGAAMLARLGLLDRLSGSAEGTEDRFVWRPFSGIRLFLPGDCELDLNFAEISDVATGLITPRFQLDCELARFAGEQPGVRLLEEFAVDKIEAGTNSVHIGGRRLGKRQTASARVVVAADGIHSRFHQRFNIRRRQNRNRRFALRATYQDTGLAQSMVQVYYSGIGEAYVAPLGNDRARITLLLFGRRSRNGPGEAGNGRSLTGAARLDAFGEAIRRFPRLCEKLPDPYPPESVEATAPVSLRVSRCHGHRLVLVGDAAGAVDAITGQGMTHALQDAYLASCILSDRLHDDHLEESDLEVYTRQREVYFKPSFQFAELISTALRRRFLARQITCALAHNASLRRKLVSAASGCFPFPRFTWTDRLHLLLGR